MINNLIKQRPMIGALLERKAELENLISSINQDISKLPPGSIHIVKSGSCAQYYLRLDKADKSGKYLRKDQREYVTKVAKREYWEAVLLPALAELSDINEFLKKHSTNEIASVYSGYRDERKSLITPVDMDDKDFVKAWESFTYEPKGFKENDPEFYTDRNERVRSKSEIFIGNALLKAGIPYRYECPFTLNNGRIIHPDFTVLNIRNHKQYFWEHLGRMDDRGYVSDNMLRLEDMRKAGIYPGRDLILTFESSDKPLTPSEIRNTINVYLK